jgi:hypothetical protein
MWVCGALAVLLPVIAISVPEPPPADPLCLFTDPCLARPVITLRGCNPCYINMTKDYNDFGATCHDRKDGNLNGQVVTIGTFTFLFTDYRLPQLQLTAFHFPPHHRNQNQTGEVIDTSKPGEYQFHYECVDTTGLSAVATRVIYVRGKTADKTKLHKATHLHTLTNLLDSRPNIGTTKQRMGSRGSAKTAATRTTGTAAAVEGVVTGSGRRKRTGSNGTSKGASGRGRGKEGGTVADALSQATCTIEENHVRRGHDIHPSVDADTRWVGSKCSRCTHSVFRSVLVLVQRSDLL